MVFFSSRISPFTSTVIFLERSPVATAVVTSAMLRTWPVRLLAMRLTLSVRSFQVPATRRTSAWPPVSLAFPYTTLCRSGHLGGEGAELIHHRIDGVLQLEDFALHIDGDFLGEVTRGHGGGHFGDVTHLGRQVARHEVHGVGEVLPGA